MTTIHTMRPRALAFAAALTLAVGAAACGDSNDDSDSGDGGQSQAAASPEEQIRALFRSNQRALIEGDGKTLCGNLAARGQREMTLLAIRPAKTCEQSVAGIAVQNRRGGAKQKPTKVVSVKLDGSDRAAVRVKDANRPVVTMTAIRRDGRWKLATLVPREAATQPRP